MHSRFLAALASLLLACSAQRSDTGTPEEDTGTDARADIKEASSDAPETQAETDASTVDTAEEADAETEPKDTGPPASVILMIPICGSPGCFGAIDTSTTCRSLGDWFAAVTKKCSAKSLTLTYFDLGDPCSGGGRSAKYSCCPKGTATIPVSKSSDGCPTHATDWAPGSPCDGPRYGLTCEYPNACGWVEEWHCKSGWALNTGCGAC